MKKIAALLLATTAISAATAGIAGVYDQDLDQDAAFLWIDDGTAAPDAADSPETAIPTPAGGTMQDGAQMGEPGAANRAPEAQTGAKAAPEQTPQAKPAPKPRNPIMEAYPEAEAPQHHVPEAAPSTVYDDSDCRPGETAASFGPKDQHLVDPALRRRGTMAGDDGVLEAIQDTPCSVFHRRGGPNAASRAEYTDPNDIRRANTLEDTRIPVHEVGRYTVEGSSLWHRDPESPFIDASSKWTVERGMMLSHMLTTWGEQAGFNVVWNSPHDYILQTDVVINGTFAEAAGQVIASFANANPPIAGDFYLNNRVLVVDSASEFDGR